MRQDRQGSNPVLKETRDIERMKPNLPNWMFVGGMGALGFSQACKDNFPETLGRVFTIHWGCALISAFCFSIGLFLSLYGLFRQSQGRRRYALPGLCNLVFLVALPSFYFFAYVVSTKIYHFADDLPGVLPKLVENAQSADTEPKRLKMAKAAYELYGVKIVYLRDGGNLTRYEPSGEEVAFFTKQKDVDRRVQESKDMLKGAMDQWPYLFAFYMGAFFLTFFFGSLWVAFRKPFSHANLQS